MCIKVTVTNVRFGYAYNFAHTATAHDDYVSQASISLEQDCDGMAE